MKTRMKPMRNSILALLCMFTIACNLPKADLATAKMEKYWQYYKVENYDSLRSFYIPKEDSSDERLSSLFKAFHTFRENYGSIQSISLTENSVSVSTGRGERIDLTYEVEFDKKVISNQFSFAKDKNGEFKIMDHSVDQNF